MHNYGRGNYQNRYRSNSRGRKIQFSGQGTGGLRYEQIIGEELFGSNMRLYQILEDRIVEENIEEIIEMKIIAEKDIGVRLQTGHFQGILIIEGTIGA